MEQVLVWLWDSTRGHGFDFVIILLAIFVAIAIYAKNQAHS
ncbi:hypothetical protein QTN94_04785 [Vibrio sp. M250220]